jgi:integrase
MAVEGPTRSARHGHRKTRHRGLSYRLLADGSKRFYGYVPRRGRVLLRATSERAAVAEYGDLRGRVGRGERIAPTNVRFGDEAQRWFESKHRIREWTRRGYRSVLDNEYLPRFGHLKLGQIQPENVGRLIREWEARGLSPKTIQNYLGVLSGVYQFAISKGRATTNPVALLTVDERPQRNGEERRPHEWSDEDISGVLDATESLACQPESRYDYSPLLRTAIYTGLRLGELLGLRWSDIDFGASVLDVRQQWSRTGELTAPKTAKALRRVPLTHEMVKFLQAHKLRSRFSKDEDFVFASRTGGPLSHRNVQRRGFERARDLAELDESLTFHSLRHAFASYAAHRGVPVNILSEVMGHRDVGVTQGVYIHLYGRAQAEDAFRVAMARRD